MEFDCVLQNFVSFRTVEIGQGCRGMKLSRLQTWSKRTCLTILWTSLVAPLVKNLPTMQETPVQSLCLEDSPGDGKGYPLWPGEYRVAKSQTLLSNFHFDYFSVDCISI